MIFSNRLSLIVVIVLIISDKIFYFYIKVLALIYLAIKSFSSMFERNLKKNMWYIDKFYNMITLIA